MIENAVTYYRDLRTQQIPHDQALLHTQQRFGVPQEALIDRLHGHVADPAATRTALSDARHVIHGGLTRGDAFDVLRELYEAITGETL